MTPKAKTQKKAEAAERQARYDVMTLTEKRIHATNPHRPGDRRRELARLLPTDEFPMTATDDTRAAFALAEADGYGLLLVHSDWCWTRDGAVVHPERRFGTTDEAVADALEHWAEQVTSCDACGSKSTCSDCARVARRAVRR